ncbi:major facilitator superfamily MFS_1 [Kribbella flavida DSM 17836]|uniref:Major facilitator superfamily MFS_1 n=1 Tax=Kribbella flavida (strain DSM 17836 / JCM 10339 / NBRC 14399) TaxID=479435 RepID=D2PZ72_KRIFD|nr:MFS transporter [Kribbella flavida]ADB33681.1 major facilitator superfamily MFS_1 [Kribbella flavida DSM 17836]
MVGGVVERARWRDVFGHSEFRALFVAGILSVAGDQLARVALSVLVYERTESAGLTALTYALTYVPDLLFGPLLAGFADRYPRRTVMIVTDLARAVIVAAMAIEALPLWVVIGLLLALQAFGSPFNAARAATLPVVLPGDHYVLGKAANDMVVQFSQVLGFGTGGVIVVAVGVSGGLLLDSGTFLLSALLIALGVRRRPAPTDVDEAGDGPRRSYFQDLAAGTSLVLRTPKLRALVALATIAGFYVTVEGLAVPYADDIGQGKEAAGLLLAASPAGAVLGMWLITLWPPERRMKLIGPLAVCACVPLVFCALEPGLLPTVGLWALSGLASAYHLPTSAAFVQAVPDHQRGQAFGVASTALKSSQGLGILLAGALAEPLGAPLALAVMGAAGTFAAVAAGAAWARAHRASADPAKSR